MRLDEHLNSWTSNTLKTYVTLLDGGSSITRKAERVDFIKQNIFKPWRLREIWKKLDPVAQRAVSVAYHNGGEFQADAFVAQYRELPPRPEEEGRSYYYYNRTPILFDLFVISGEIPSDLMPLLSDLVLEPERFQIEGIEELPEETETWQEYYVPLMQADTEQVGQMDLFSYLRLLEQGQLKFSTTNKQLTAASIRKVLGILLEGDFYPPPEKPTGKTVIRPFALDTFAQNCGFANGKGQLTRKGRVYLEMQTPESMLEAFERWTEKSKFDEFQRVFGIGGKGSRSTRLTASSSRREKIIEALSWCPAGTWININDFYRAIKIWQFDFDMEVSGYSNLHIGSSYYGDLNSVGGGTYWLLTNGSYVKTVLWEYLATLGLIDIGYIDAEDEPSVYEHIDDVILSHFDGLRYFRINNWGAYLLGQASEYVQAAPSEKTFFDISAEREVRVTTKLTPSDRLQLEAVTEELGADRYHLEATRVLTAVENGQDLKRIEEFFAAHNAGSLPQEVTEWFATLRKNKGLFRTGKEAVLIQIKNPTLFDVVEKNAGLAKICKRIDDSTLMVLKAHQSRLKTLLMGEGYLLT